MTIAVFDEAIFDECGFDCGRIAIPDDVVGETGVTYAEWPHEFVYPVTNPVNPRYNKTAPKTTRKIRSQLASFVFILASVDICPTYFYELDAQWRKKLQQSAPD